MEAGVVTRLKYAKALTLLRRETSKEREQRI